MLFPTLAQHEAREFLRDTRYQRVHRLSPALSRTSLQISEVCTTRRRERAQGKPMVVGDISDEALYRRMFGKRLTRKLMRSTLYADHFDAACALSIPLLNNSIGLNVGRRSGRVVDQRDRATLVRCAVRELHRAIDCADSQVMALRWDWIVSEDPDLDELRRTTQFRAFEAARLPSAKRAPRRSSQAQQIELARHAAQLVSSAARMLEREWHNRASRADGGRAIDVHDVHAWWDEQRENWDAVARLAIDHRDWRTRLQWIHRMQSQALRQGSRAFVIRHPVYAEDPIDVHALSGGASQLDDTALRRIKAAAARMARLDEFLRESFVAFKDPEGARAWRTNLLRFDALRDDLGGATVRELCRGCAALWAGLALWFEAEVDSPAAVEAAARDLFDAHAGLAELCGDLLEPGPAGAGSGDPPTDE
jgi:hypothetical protein